MGKIKKKEKGLEKISRMCYKRFLLYERNYEKECKRMTGLLRCKIIDYIIAQNYLLAFLFLIGIKNKPKITRRENVKLFTRQQHTLVKVCVVVAVLLLFTTDVYSMIYFNGVKRIFEVEGSTELKGASIGSDVVNGAVYFLRSHSDALLFLEKAEASELESPDYNELLLHLNNAIDNMLQARAVYIQLKQAVDITPYNQSMIDVLSNFNYDLFQEKNGLIKPIFVDVKAFLSKGKIRELCGEILVHIQGVLDIAYSIKANLESGQFPALKDLWNLNECYSRSLLFGEYAARVFLEMS